MREFNLFGVMLLFNRNTEKGGFYFTEPKTGHGFYPNDKYFTSIWGKPTYKNYTDVAEFYISSNKYRLKALKTYI